MMNIRAIAVFLIALPLVSDMFAAEIPHLKRQGSSTQLIVDGSPFLIRGGELGNSTASNLDYLGQYWNTFRELNLNTVLAPVYWDLVEPAEGQFDFSLVDQLIEDARRAEMKLVLLWFGSWKNSMSSYCPEWVKTDYGRFPRSRGRNGEVFEILSPFHEENHRADASAFRALMRHLKEFDGKHHTVLMVQPENEIGMVEYARDYSPAANERFAAEVPAGLMDYLAANRARLTPELKAAWATSGFVNSGDWSQVFGGSAQADEIFMAWHYARYADQVASAGKEEYPLPMFVNAALIRPGYQPGQYISAGPLPHLIDIWRAGAPSVDFIAPDIYFPDFAEWAGRYTRNGNPLFIPEALRSPQAAVNALYAFGEHDAIGFCPFGIESISGMAKSMLSGSYDIIGQISPLIARHQGTGRMRGLLQVSDRQKAPAQIRLGDYEMNVSFEYAAPPSLADGVINESGDLSAGGRTPAGGLVIHLDENRFLFAGMGMKITFDSLEPGEQAGIVSAESGRFVQGEWENRLWNNGDQTHQGRHVRLVPGQFDVQIVKLYRYR